jgi:uncharacterized protein (DUF2249 family)
MRSPEGEKRMSTQRVVDVRDDIRRGEEPFDRIMGAAASLGDGEELVILNLFEPVPLYGVLGQQGFSHETVRTPEGDWRVTFRRGRNEIR